MSTSYNRFVSFRRIANSLSVAAFITSPLRADVVPNPLFSDGAVLQRGQAVPVWGTARDGEKVTVEFAGQKVTTTATAGKWEVNLTPLEAGGPFVMRITGDNVTTVKDILVGEVWLCSGQSNMHFRMGGVENSAQEIAAANHPALRFFNVAQQMAQSPSHGLQGTWQTVSPETAGQCSAVAYYFGRDLQKKLGVPVGLINSSVGGTRIESWMRAETLAATGQAVELVRKWADVPPDEFERIGKEYSAFQYQRDHVHPKAVKQAKAEGLPPPEAPVAPKIRTHDSPSALHNGMIAPLQPFAIRGAIWYQGESNSKEPGPYQKLLPAMIGDWRDAWGKEMPFLFVQLAAYRSTHPGFREAQQLIWQNTPHTGMAVTTDVGMAENIHPTRKHPVGERLATAARALVYGEKIVYSGPVFKDMKIDGGRAVISFNHEGGGLVAKEGELRGFTLAGEDKKKFVPATASIEGNTVVVTSDQIARPAAVRYNWAMMTDGNLYNRENLPAVPFRTDRPDSPTP